jgi:hypothetical protein
MFVTDTMSVPAGASTLYLVVGLHVTIYDRNPKE